MPETRRITLRGLFLIVALVSVGLAATRYGTSQLGNAGGFLSLGLSLGGVVWISMVVGGYAGYLIRRTPGMIVGALVGTPVLATLIIIIATVLSGQSMLLVLQVLLFLTVAALFVVLFIRMWVSLIQTARCQNCSSLFGPVATSRTQMRGDSYMVKYRCGKCGAFEWRDNSPV